MSSVLDIFSLFFVLGVASEGLEVAPSALGVLDLSIWPSPVRSQSPEILKSITIFCIAVVPTALLPFDISVTIDGLMPNLRAKSFLSAIALTFKRCSNAAIKRPDTSFLVLIIQNIEK